MKQLKTRLTIVIIYAAFLTAVVGLKWDDFFSLAELYLKGGLLLSDTAYVVSALH